MGAKWFYQDNKYIVTDKFGKRAMFIKDGGQIGSDWSHEIQLNPDRMLYFQRTHVGTITAGKAMTGMMISQTFKGAADSGNLVGLEVKSRGNSTRTDHDVDNMYAIVGNVDVKKTDVSGTAKCIEAVIEGDTNSTIAEARAITAKIQSSGTVTNGYAGYFEGHANVYVKYGVYIRYATNALTIASCTGGISVTTTDASGGAAGVKSVTTLTSTGAVAGRAIDGQVVYTPATAGSGGSVPIGVAGKVTLTTGCTSTLYLWGVQGQVNLEANAVINCGQIAAMRAVLTADANPTITDGNISCIYCDNLIATALNAGGATASMLRLANHGGQMDCVFHLNAGHTTHLFDFDQCTIESFITTSEGKYHGGTMQKLKCDYDGVTYYILMSTAPTSS